MPGSVFGLPLHPLVVHAAVTLVLLAAVLAIVIAVDPERRNRWGTLVWWLTVVATVATVVARASGQRLGDSLYPAGLPDPVIRHQSVGLTAPWVSFALLLGVGAMVLLDRDRERRPDPRSTLLPSVVSVVVILLAMAAALQVGWTAWTGAEARWGT